MLFWGGCTSFALPCLCSWILGWHLLGQCVFLGDGGLLPPALFFIILSNISSWALLLGLGGEWQVGALFFGPSGDVLS